MAERNAAKYGLEVVSVDQYKQDDADLSVQISKARSAGAGAILKIGLGGTTLTAAEEHQAARRRYASAEPAWRTSPCSGGFGGAGRQVLLRRFAVTGL